VFELLENFDHQLMIWLNSFHVDWLDRPMYILTQTLASGPWLIFLLYLLYLKGGFKYIGLVVLGIGVVVLFSDQLSVHLFKNVFMRYRPSHNLDVSPYLHFVHDWKGNLYKGGAYGFVSSHATNFFGLSMFLWLSLKPSRKSLTLLIFGWATLISYTRIYLGVHYPSDIIGGALLGSFIGLVVWKIKDILRKKYFAPMNTQQT
jgi:undecaprenyl-diphosphatase